MLENLDFQVLRRRAPIIVALMILGALAALVVSQLREVEYESHAQLMVGPGVDSPNPDLNVLRASAQLIQMYAELPLTEPFLQNVIDEVGLEMRPGQLEDYIEVSPNQDTLILTVTVTYPDPEIAAAIASSIADQLVTISPSNPESPAAQLKGQLQAQSSALEATVQQIEDHITQLESDYTNVAGLASPSTGTGQYANFMSDNLSQQQITEISGTAAAQSTVGLDILQELVANASARIQVFEQQLTADASTATRQILIQQITAERSHLSQLQQAIAELQRPVGGVSLDEYIQVNQQELSNLEGSADVANFDLRRLQFERILEQQSRLDAARTIETDRQKLILDQVARERDRISQIELSGTVTQQAIRDEIAAEQSRLVETQNALALLYDSLRQAEPNQVRIVEVGSQPKELDTPVFLAMMIGAVAGLGLSVLGVLAIESANNIIDTADELRHVLPVPAVVDTSWNVGPAEYLLNASEPTKRQVQNSQMLALGLIYNQGEAMSKFVVVTAADDTGGAGTAAANLAITLALSGKRVLLVDAEGGGLQSITGHFNLEGRGGLAEFLDSAELEPATIVEIDRYPTLTVWPLGMRDIEPGMLSSPRMLYHLKNLRAKTDVILIAAPVYRRPDALMLASEASGVVLTATKGVTNTRVLRELLDSLKQVKASVIAAILRPAKETGLWYDLRRVPSAGPLPRFDVGQAKTLPGLPIQRPAVPVEDDLMAPPAPADEPIADYAAPTAMIEPPPAAKTQEMEYGEQVGPSDHDRSIDEYMAKTIASGMKPISDDVDEPADTEEMAPFLPLDQQDELLSADALADTEDMPLDQQDELLSADALPDPDEENDELTELDSLDRDRRDG